MCDLVANRVRSSFCSYWFPYLWLLSFFSLSLSEETMWTYFGMWYDVIQPGLQHLCRGICCYLLLRFAIDHHVMIKHGM